MNILLSTISHDSRKEFSKSISLPVIPSVGETIISNNTKFVAKERVFVADQDAQIISDCHVQTTEELLKSWGFEDTSAVDYHAAPVVEVKPEIKPQQVPDDAGQVGTIFVAPDGIREFKPKKGHRK